MKLCVLAGAVMLDARPATSPGIDQSRPAPRKTVAALETYRTFIDPAFSTGLAPAPLGQIPPLSSDFVAAAPPAVAPEPQREALVDIPLPPSPPSPLLAQELPLPPARPPELRAPVQAPEPLKLATRQQPARQSKAATLLAAPAPDNRNFFEKILGIQPQQQQQPQGQQQPAPRGPTLAYAAPENDAFGKTQGNRFGLGSGLGLGGGLSSEATAIYDISARTVYMPNGERLEAHSGLGEMMDDPRHVHRRMRGATPPNIYNLTMREALFHGVQALRLTPVGSTGTYGRTGLLAHSYMLGPRGDSNGCVSFRDYNKFLQAFLRGEVKRLVVVTGG